MKTNQSMMKRIQMVASTMLLLTVVAACGNKGGNSNPVYDDNYYADCVGCANGKSTIATAVGESNFFGQQEAEITLEFYGQNQYQRQYMQQQQGYTGPVSARGYLRVFSNTFCNLNPGNYRLTTVQPGQWQGLMFGGLVLRATTGQQVTLTFGNAWINSAMPSRTGFDGRPHPHNLQGYVQVGSLNNPYISCGSQPILLK
ncbi:MAG TPA: hypothetical protein VM432_08445 [Bdellovibrionales bacterium]|nr:hypothetical protein [Bdellovibrionales bacterium]